MRTGFGKVQSRRTAIIIVLSNVLINILGTRTLYVKGWQKKIVELKVNLSFRMNSRLCSALCAIMLFSPTPALADTIIKGLWIFIAFLSAIFTNAMSKKLPSDEEL